MAKSTTRAQRARHAASAAGSNPYLKRVIEDEDLRASVVTAFEAARDAYARLSSNGSVIDTAIDDNKLHGDLRTAAENLREASNRLRGREQRKTHTFGRLLLIAVAGAVLALVLSEELRKSVLDAIFGAEEEFEYTSTTTPAPTPAATE